MRILGIQNSNYNKIYRQAQKSKTAVTFQAAPIKKIQSTKIFELEKDLEPLWLRPQEEFLAKLKEFAHIDINSRNYNGDTIFTKAIKEKSNFFRSLIYMEKHGEIEGVNWNATDANRDNILMLIAKSNSRGFIGTNNIVEAIKLAKEGKIDPNYVNEQQGYSLIECALIYDSSMLSTLLEIKNLDVNQVAKYSKSNINSILKLAINRGIFPRDFEMLISHPKMDLSHYNIEELYRYIDEAPFTEYDPEASDYWDHNTNKRCVLNKYHKEKYKEAIEIGLKVQNAKKIAKYYEENGILTLDQIEKYVDNANCEMAINYPLNSIDETIAHFLAETYIAPNDKQSIQKVKNIIDKMRKSVCYFWKRDAIERTPVMLALEYENFVVARAMLERMVDSEIKKFSFNERGWLPICAIKKDSNDQEIPLRELIKNLEPTKRNEFEQLLNERLQTY